MDFDSSKKCSDWFALNFMECMDCDDLKNSSGFIWFELSKIHGYRWFGKKYFSDRSGLNFSEILRFK